jgi:hypothetical protein
VAERSFAWLKRPQALRNQSPAQHGLIISTWAFCSYRYEDVEQVPGELTTGCVINLYKKGEVGTSPQY